MAGAGDDGSVPVGTQSRRVARPPVLLRAPASCAAADVGNTPLGTDTPDATGTAVSAITYTNVGVTGSYDKVVTSTVAPTCVANVCQKTAKDVSGPLVPFDEEMTMVFSGPMDLYQVAAYEPASGGLRARRVLGPCTTEGLAFVGNKSWYQCNGYVQSYVTDDGTASSADPGAVRRTPRSGRRRQRHELRALHRHHRRNRLRLQPRPGAARLQGRRGRQQDLRDEVPHAARRT